MNARACILALVAVGCAGGTSTSSAPPEVEHDVIGASRATRERPEEAPSVELGPATYRTVALGTLDDVEDGAGGRGEAVAVAVDLDSRRFPARALDPVLFVGALEHHAYRYLEEGTLRFVVRADALTPDARLAVGYGDDPLGRIELVPAAEVVSGSVGP